MSDTKYKDLLTAHGVDAEKRRRNAAALHDVATEFLGPKSVIDIGCGAGFLISAFRTNGAEVLGVDGPWIDEVELETPRECYQVHDLREPFAHEQRWDMAACLEVGEHLPRDRAESLVADLCALSDIVFFSAAIPNQGGVGHINEQWQSYWAQKFADQGYAVFDPFRPMFAGRREIFSWFRQNLLVFIKTGTARAAELEAYRVEPARTSLVLPEVHERILNRLVERARASAAR